ncbi:hypothetical protein DT23_15545 [Thioclava indica]|uniref:Glycosyltransferase 2-like domain-containing protein n=2 Tax=Thioclava indica TaxID=1353528 RepID=A0A074JQF9_9RHOB|nr:hypothetical protein DT23_15545 [Thioclava indica]
MIGLCTFRRAAVSEALASLGALMPPEGITITIAVADNDTMPTARERVEAAARDMPFALQYLHAPARNISRARNAILEAAQEARADYLAFIDDDETVDKAWLDVLLRAHLKSGAGAIVGPVRAAYRLDAPEWMVQGAVHDTEPDITAKGFAHTGYTCNVLLDLRDPDLTGLRFDLHRGRSGGEDTAYFSQYQARGGKIVYTPDAIVRELVPPERAKLSWLLQRRIRMGQTHGNLICAGRGLGGRIQHASLATAKAAFCLLAAVIHSFTPLSRNRALMRGALHLGTLSGCLGGQALTIYGAANQQSENKRSST